MIVDPVGIPLNRPDRDKGFHGNAHIGDAIHAVIDHVSPIGAVTHEIIALVAQDQLVRTDVLNGASVEFLVKTVFIVVVSHHFPGRDRLVNQLDVIEQRFVFGLVPLADRMNVPYVARKITVGEPADLVYQFP